MKICIPENILSVMNLLADKGYEVYIVGGCVRDAYLNKEPDDWDVTTSATPEQMKCVFNKFRVIETGIKHGTLSVIVDDEPIEITTMRVDGDYTDNRHPDCVVFTCDIHKDLARRDFTVNAMAYNPEKGLIDPFGGIEDIDNKIIRCVGEEDKRFNEDALRIMRALRFSSTLGFDIDIDTAQSIKNNKALLNNVAKERIRVELLKLLCGERVKEILLDFCQVFFEIIPELEPMYKLPQLTPFHIYDVWEHTVASVEAVDNDPILKTAMLLHDIGKPQMLTIDQNGTYHFKNHQNLSAEKSVEILNRLRFSRKEQEEISKLILYHDIRPEGEVSEVIRLCVDLSPMFLLRLLSVLRADAMAKSKEYLAESLDSFNKVEKIVNKLIEDNVCMSLADLDINGNDLAEMGIKGKLTGDILEKMLDNVSQGRIKNNRQEILTYIKENYLLN